MHIRIDVCEASVLPLPKEGCSFQHQLVRRSLRSARECDQRWTIPARATGRRSGGGGKRWGDDTDGDGGARVTARRARVRGCAPIPATARWARTRGAAARSVRERGRMDLRWSGVWVRWWWWREDVSATVGGATQAKTCLQFMLDMLVTSQFERSPAAKQHNNSKSKNKNKSKRSKSKQKQKKNEQQA